LSRKQLPFSWFNPGQVQVVGFKLSTGQRTLCPAGQVPTPNWRWPLAITKIASTLTVRADGEGEGDGDGDSGGEVRLVWSGLIPFGGGKAPALLCKSLPAPSGECPWKILWRKRRAARGDACAVKVTGGSRFGLYLKLNQHKKCAPKASEIMADKW